MDKQRLDKFKLAQAAIIGLEARKQNSNKITKHIILEGNDKIALGDCLDIIEVSLVNNYLVVECAGATESYMPIGVLSDFFIDTIIEKMNNIVLREL